MDFSERRFGWIDTAIWVTVIAVVGVALYLGYAIAAGTKAKEQGTPVNRALVGLRETVKKNPKNVEARLRLATGLDAAGREDEAIEQYKTVLKLEKSHPSALAGMARIATERKEWRTAEGYWKKVISLLETGTYAGIDRRLQDAYYGLGVMYYEEKDWEEAARSFRESLRIRRDDSMAHYMLGLSYKNMGVAQKAKEELQITLAFDPKMAEANYELALMLLKEGDKAQAAELLRVSIDNAPEGVDLPQQELDKMGTAEEHAAASVSAEKAGDKAEALQEARIAAAMDSKNIEALRRVAHLFESQKKMTSAQKAYENLLLMAPGDDDAVAALKRLGKDD